MSRNAGLAEAELAVLGAAPLAAGDPDRVGRYRLLGLLGVGGMGRVYLAEADGRLIAVKVIRPELADDPRFRRRFSHELEAVSRLDLACTAPLVDAETDATRPWMATEYIPGLSLAEAVGEGVPLSVPAVRRLAAGVGTALAAIHRAGVIHRDLKPSNVILAVDGPKVIDFGVAHAADLSQLTVTGQHIGTPSYMAPEQARTGAVGPASDVFALGALLTFAATGRPPFGDGTTTEVLFRVVYEPPELSALADLDADLHALVERCLDKEPANRPDAEAVVATVADAGSVAEWPEPLRSRIEPKVLLAGRTLPLAPRAAVSGETAVADQSGLPRRPAPVPPQPARKWVRRLAVTAAAAVVTAVAVVAATTLWPRDSVAVDAAPAHHPTAATSTTASSTTTSSSSSEAQPMNAGPPVAGGAPAAGGGAAGGGSGAGSAASGGGQGSTGGSGGGGGGGSSGGGAAGAPRTAASVRYSFEDGADGWNPAGTDANVADSTAVGGQNGSRALQVSDYASGSNDFPYVRANTSGSGPVAGQTVTAWVRVPSAVSGSVGAKIFVQQAGNGAWHYNNAFTTVSAGGGWQQLSYVCAGYSGGATQVGVQFFKSTGSTVTFYLDAVNWG